MKPKSRPKSRSRFFRAVVIEIERWDWWPEDEASGPRFLMTDNDFFWASQKLVLRPLSLTLPEWFRARIRVLRCH